MCAGGGTLGGRRAPKGAGRVLPCEAETGLAVVAAPGDDAGVAMAGEPPIPNAIPESEAITMNRRRLICMTVASFHWSCCPGTS